jgi:hypothetical protein
LVLRIYMCAINGDVDSLIDNGTYNFK